MRKRKLMYNTVGDKVLDAIVAVILILFVVVTVYPIINTVAVSFNDGTDALRGGITLWPRVWSTKNYETVFQKQNLLVGAKNSVLKTVLGTVTQLFATALLSYVLSRKNFIFKRSVAFFFVVTMYVNGGLVPNFLLLRNLHLTNTFWVYIIPCMLSAFNMLVIRTYMSALPDSLVESAEIDGAGHFTIFIKIIVPLCLPVFATVALFIAVWQWNAWFEAMIYNRLHTEYTTLQYELMKLLSSVSSNKQNAETMKNAANTVTPATVRAAATVITALPIVCLYPFLQRYFVTGLTIGGVKE